MYELLKELGLFALPFPAEYGGTGSTLAACIAVEEFGRVCYNTGYLLVVQWTPFGAILAGGTGGAKAGACCRAWPAASCALRCP
jgi:alkylation response protein AidB-like acyl-CoA dehydrogenase